MGKKGMAYKLALGTAVLLQASKHPLVRAKIGLGRSITGASRRFTVLLQGWDCWARKGFDGTRIVDLVLHAVETERAAVLLITADAVNEAQELADSMQKYNGGPREFRERLDHRKTTNAKTLAVEWRGRTAIYLLCRQEADEVAKRIEVKLEPEQWLLVLVPMPEGKSSWRDATRVPEAVRLMEDLPPPKPSPASHTGPPSHERGLRFAEQLTESCSNPSRYPDLLTTETLDSTLQRMPKILRRPKYPQPALQAPAPANAPADAPANAPPVREPRDRKRPRPAPAPAPLPSARDLRVRKRPPALNIEEPASKHARREPTFDVSGPVSLDSPGRLCPTFYDAAPKGGIVQHGPGDGNGRHSPMAGGAAPPGDLWWGTPRSQRLRSASPRDGRDLGDALRERTLRVAIDVLKTEPHQRLHPSQFWIQVLHRVSTEDQAALKGNMKRFLSSVSVMEHVQFKQEGPNTSRDDCVILVRPPSAASDGDARRTRSLDVSRRHTENLKRVSQRHPHVPRATLEGLISRSLCVDCYVESEREVPFTHQHLIQNHKNQCPPDERVPISLKKKKNRPTRPKKSTAHEALDVVQERAKTDEGFDDVDKKLNTSLANDHRERPGKHVNTVNGNRSNGKRLRRKYKNGSKRKKYDGKCWNCGTFGHSAQDCRKNHGGASANCDPTKWMHKPHEN
mmetsp:Transcript_13719/g.40545  ORF Transcript_13719/g.40545 Transcript_13719/m.40545 type:complete len:681 (+) Transcript_13719:236-2278(+)